nr:MFS transporter [Methanobacterium petrolearium]
MQSGESPKDFVSDCDCGGKLKYVENLDIVDPTWKQTSINRKSTKSEILKEKIQSLSSLPGKFKNRLVEFYYNNFGKWIYNLKNHGRVHKTSHRNPYGMGPGFMNSIMNELNFQNIRWVLVIPVAAVITLILAFTQGIFTLFTFLLLLAVGYLSDNMVIGAKNAVVTGAISFLLGSLFAGSFLYIIPYTLLGVINGAVCGLIGGYIKNRI